MKKFYSHLVEIETLTIELDSMDLSQDEKSSLGRLADSNLHHAILDSVLTELDEKDKIIFLDHLRDGNNDKIWELLNNKVEKIEDKIKKTASELKKQLHQDIKETKRLHGIPDRKEKE